MVTHSQQSSNKLCLISLLQNSNTHTHKEETEFNVNNTTQLWHEDIIDYRLQMTDHWALLDSSISLMLSSASLTLRSRYTFFCWKSHDTQTPYTPVHTHLDPISESRLNKLSLTLISELIEPELGSSWVFKAADQKSEGGVFTVSHHQWRADHTIHNGGVKSRVTYFIPTEIQILTTVFRKSLEQQLQLNRVRWHKKRLQCTLMQQLQRDSSVKDQSPARNWAMAVKYKIVIVHLEICRCSFPTW